MSEQKPELMQKSYKRRPLEGGREVTIPVKQIPENVLEGIRRSENQGKNPCSAYTYTKDGQSYSILLEAAQAKKRERTPFPKRPSVSTETELPANNNTSQPKVEENPKGGNLINIIGLLVILTIGGKIVIDMGLIDTSTSSTPPQTPIGEKKELPSQKAPIVTMSPTKEPTRQPTLEPTKVKPTEAPTKTAPTEAPTEQLKVEKTVIITAGGNAFKAFKDLGGKFGETYRFELRNKNGDVVKIREIKVENTRDLPSDVKPGEIVSLLGK